MKPKNYNNDDFIHIGSIIKETLETFQKKSYDDFKLISKIWQNAVGMQIAQNTKPISLKKNTLLVHVSHSTWIHHLQFMRNNIIKNINIKLQIDVVNEIKFKIGSI